MPSSPANLLLVVLAIAAASASAMAQVEPEAEGGPVAIDDIRMLTPAPVSEMMYPTVSAIEERTNYLASSLVVDVAHLNNVLPGLNASPRKDTIYSFVPSLLLDRTSPRQQLSATYLPTLTFYEPDSPLDAVDQSASLIYQNHPGPYTAIMIQDFFTRTSDVFSGSYPFSQGGLTGSAQASGPTAIAPFAEQLTNTANASGAYQFRRNSMAGIDGRYSIFNYPNPAQAQGLNNSKGGGASAFYDQRFTGTHYAGISYDYNRVLSDPGNTQPAGSQIDAKVHSILPFYTWYLSRTFSFSISGGTQRVSVTQPPQPGSKQPPPPANLWSPAGVVSVGWQGNRGAISASYLHTVIVGGGLAGAFNSDSGNATGSWTFRHMWSANAAFTYSTIAPAVQLTGLGYQGGDTITASASVLHEFSEQFTLEGGYQRLHENFGGITAILQNPDSDRIFLTATYRFNKPLGR